MKITRREFIKGSLTTGAFIAAGGAGVLFTPRRAHAFAQSPNLQKFISAAARRGGTGIPVHGTRHCAAGMVAAGRNPLHD